MYKNFRGRSLGRILHYVNETYGLYYAERVALKNSNLVLGDKLFAKVIWKKVAMVEVPVLEVQEGFPELKERKSKSIVMAEDIIREQASIIENLLNTTNYLYSNVREPKLKDSAYHVELSIIKDYVERLA